MAGAGYFAGGHNGSTPSTQITKLSFSDESAATLGASLPSSLYAQAGASAPTRGLLFAGSNGTEDVATIEALQFSNESAANLAASLIAAINNAACVWSSSAAYIGTMNYSGAPTNFIIKFNFSDDTSDLTAATLSVVRAAGGGVSSATRGYWGGGSSGSKKGDIDGIQFSDDSAINPSAALSGFYNRDGLAGTMSSANGYFGAGSTGSEQKVIDKLVFSSESASLLSATLETLRTRIAAVSSSARGYYGGGYGSGAKDEIDGIKFSDDSAINPSAALATARYYLSGFFSTPPPPQLLAPVSGVSAGSWTPSSGFDLYAMLDEAAANDADYIVTPGASTCEVALAVADDPAVSTDHVVRYRISAANGGITVRLRQGITTIASWTHAPAPTTPTTYAQTLSGAEADSITDYAALRLQFEATT